MAAVPLVRLIGIIGMLIGGACSSQNGELDAQVAVGQGVSAQSAEGSPFVGEQLWVNPSSEAAKLADRWSAHRPAEAELMRRIASQPQVKWFPTWERGIRTDVDTALATITRSGALPVLVAYAIPHRDCGSYAAGGAPSADEYLRWIRGFAEGIGSRKAVVILEPDALAETGCLSQSELQERLELLRRSIAILKANPRTYVYLDAGNPLWMEPARIAERMRSAGIAEADGFTLNISNFQTTADNIAFGTAVSRLVAGKRFLIDTSRNGLGPSVPYEWCNPRGRALGDPPSTAPEHPLVDALLWIKWPGESDGECNGGPEAGAWWPEYALGLAERTPNSLRAGTAEHFSRAH